MTNSPQVKINIDTAEEIAKLYDIGPKSAEHIVKYRDTHGFFSGPEDLAKVDGISLNLAITLSPHIDWSVPSVKPESSKKRNYFSALVGVWIIAAILYYVAKDLPNLWNTIKACVAATTTIYNISFVWTEISLLAGRVFVLIGSFFYVLWSLTRSSTRGRQFFRTTFLFFGIGILAFLSYGLSYVVYYQFYAPDGWREITHPLTLRMIFSVVISVLIVGPNLIVVWHPKLRFSHWIVRIYDIGFVLSAPLYGFGIWVLRSISIPLWILVLHAFIGFITLFLGVLIIRGESMFEAALIVDPYILPQEQDKVSAWRAWLNARLPDPEQQKELKYALDEAYPPSRIRTLIGIIIFGVGGWLLVTAIGAIVEWFVQKGLDKLW